MAGRVRVITMTTAREKFIIAVAMSVRMRKMRANTLAILQLLESLGDLREIETECIREDVR